MQHFHTKISLLFLLFCFHLSAQQLPNNNFESWGGEFDGNVQPTSWNCSNVTQFGYKFNFAHRETGHNSDYCLMVQDQDLKVAGIGETSPGYVALGQPWVYIESLTKVSEATAGTEGGISWKYRPDTMAVWVKRTGSNAMSEDFHLLYYSWSGTAKSGKYKGKNRECTSTSRTNEESDIRLSTDGNECGTTTPANQIAEGWVYGRKIYNDWTQIKVPIFYLNNTTPEMMNVIFSASNYPNFRANDGLYAGNSLYVDDVELIYSSKIQQMIIGGEEWKGFNPNTTEVQTYTLAEGANTIPTIKAMRGIGQLTNSAGVTTTFRGRQLQGNEISITTGEIDKTPTVITVQAEDGSSKTVYQILFSHKASNNANLNNILVDSQAIKGFSPYYTDYTAEIPFGVTSAPMVSVEKQEEQQQVQFTQPTSLNDVTTILVTAPDKETKKTYTVRYKQALLNDNTLKDILVNGKSVAGFSPTKTSYRVSISPQEATKMPEVKAISSYADGLQTIVMTPPSVIDGGVYKITVTTPGNQTPKEYKLTFKVELSSYCYLNDILLDGVSLPDFDPTKSTYSYSLNIGTTKLPKIEYVLGEGSQKVTIAEGGLDGTTRITVTAANGDQFIYRITFSTVKSTITTLDGIWLDGVMIEGFDKNITSYTVQLPIGTTTLPKIEVIKGDPYQDVTVHLGELNGITRITVQAGNGSSTIYQITFSVFQATVATLLDITINGEILPGFNPNVFEYFYELPHGTTQLPTIGYTPYDQYQTITTRSNGVDGDYRITVRPQSGASNTYIIHFSVPKSSNSALKMIYLDGKPIANFSPQTLEYTDTLDAMVLPNVTYDADAGQKVFILYDESTCTIKVTAEDGSSTTYTIFFVVRVSANAFLSMIYLDGDSLKGFEPEKLNYSDIVIANHICPTITVDSEEGQQVTILSPASTGTASIIVTAGTGNKNTYFIDLIDTTSTTIKPLDPDPEYIFSNDATLRAILVNGDALATFSPQQTTYTLPLPAGESIPAISFVSNTEKQTVVTGQVSPTQFSAFVTAENGDTSRYVVTVEIAQYDNALLKSLAINGQYFQFDPNIFAYQMHLTEGESLPKVTYEAYPGATTMFYELDINHQQIIVTAQSGKQNTYIISYTREQSNYALLSNIFIDKDSALTDFDPKRFDYVDSLQWRSNLVPCVNAIPGHSKQTITTAYSAVNGITRIHVLAADGKTKQDYTIAFPVKKSCNTLLNDLSIETNYAASLDFEPERTDYAITLPYNATTSPIIHYELAEPEQSASLVLRPIGQTNEIIVHAEDGTTRTYSITFQRDCVPTNELQAIYAIVDLESKPLTLIQDQYDYTIDLPYGTSSMTIDYVKSFDEQTVVVQPGGIYKPTVLTVYSSLAGTTATYTLTPNLDTQNPAVLKGITVNGSYIEDFDPNRFSYIVPVSSEPNVQISVPDGANYYTLVQNSKNWKIQVNNGGYSNLYTLWFYYITDSIPNGEFTDWTTAKYNKAVKPTGWHMLADYFDKCDSWKAVCLGSNYSDEHLERSDNDKVHLITSYKCNMARAVPSFITLGTISGEYNTNSNFQVSGGITFRNTPDLLCVNYKQDDIANRNIIRYELTGANGIYSHDWNNDKKSDFTTHSFDLSDANSNAGYPNSMNITINSYYSFTGDLGNGKTDASMYIDYVRFSYNNAISKIFVNEKAADQNNNAFSYTLSSSTDNALPLLRFEGEVSDQAQKVVWKDPQISGDYSIRNATITNYGEDGKSTEYTLEVKRPLDTNKFLKSININNAQLAEFQNSQFNYTYTLPYGTLTIPDIHPELANKLQTCKVSYNSVDSIVNIRVMNEKGESCIYSIKFQTASATDNTLKDIAADGITFDPNQSEYTIEAQNMPALAITKQYNEQIVTAADGHISVTLDGMPTQTYVIKLKQPTPAPTSGLLTELEMDGNLLSEFDSNTFSYEHAIPTWMSFTRQDAIDSVVFVRKPDTLQWYVYGTDSHTYQLSKPQEKAATTDLDRIYANGELIEGFNAQIKDYTIYSDSAIQLQVVGVDERQQITIQQNQSIYTIDVTSPDKSATATTIVRILPTTSSDAHLDSIFVDGQLIPLYNPNLYQYTIELPVGSYKDHEPIIPSIRYVTAHPKATVEYEINKLGESSYLIVTAQDGLTKATYELFFKAEPSHNAYLSAIAVNNIPLTSFQKDRYFYSVQTLTENVTIDWRSQDRFQTVTVTNEGNTYTLHLLAQDSITSRNYVVEIYNQALSPDATLSNILLDGQNMDEYRVDINKGLAFNPGMNKYIINIPSHLASLPNVSASLNITGQTIQISQQNKTILLTVTAPDGNSHNTYTLQFDEILSQNTSLKGILLNTDSMANFSPDQFFYFIPLASGERSIPDVTPLWNRQTQKVDTTIASLPIGQQVIINVTAEDGITTAQYRLIFQLTPSDADTLQMIYADGLPLEGFQPHLFEYSIELPRTATHIPQITWEQADEWQTVIVDTITHTAFTLCCSYTVTAESGRSNRYMVTYFMQPSANNCLKTIYINNLPLVNFDSLINDYVVSLRFGEKLDTIFWEKGDKYQTITLHDTISQLLPEAIATKQIHVMAENGNERIYTLCFVEAPSQDSTLIMIYHNGIPVENYDELTTSYNIQLSKGELTMPIITFTKHNDKQIVEIGILDSCHVQLIVTAANGKAQSIYTLTFKPYLSNYAMLQSINTNDGMLEGFAPDVFAYETTIDSLHQMPFLSYVKAEDKQEVSMDTSYLRSKEDLIYDIIYTISVTAEDQVSSEEYVITFHIKENTPIRPEDSENSRLSMISVRDQNLSMALGFNQDFTPEVTEYYLIYPIGTDPSIFFAINDICALQEDSLAVVNKSLENIATVKDTADNEILIATCIHIIVKAPAGNLTTYNIYQNILLDSLNHTTELMIADNEGVMHALNGFNPSIYYYEYILNDTYNAPAFALNYDNTDSRFACVKQSMGNNSRVVDSDDDTNYEFDESEEDPTYRIYYRAENGTKYTYKIKFRRSEINRTQKPMEGDVLIQPITGSTQIAVASLRANVVFSIYDMSGTLVETTKLPEGNPNNFVTVTDGYGQIYFGHLSDYSSCKIITLEANKIYFWVFTENGKRKIKSGKLIILP